MFFVVGALDIFDVLKEFLSLCNLKFLVADSWKEHHHFLYNCFATVYPQKNDFILTRPNFTRYITLKYAWQASLKNKIIIIIK